MNLCLCLDREDIVTSKNGNNFAISIQGNPNFQIILTPRAYDEIVADVTAFRKSEEEAK